MLGFECRRAVVQEPRARHSAMQQQQQKLICWRRSSWQFEAGVDDPHTERKISRRPFSTCRTSRPNLEAEHAHLLVQESSRAWLCQQATTDSQMKQGTMIELGWVLDTSMEQSMPSKHQHKPAQLHVQHCNVAVVAPQLWNTRKVASKPTTLSLIHI